MKPYTTFIIITFLFVATMVMTSDYFSVSTCHQQMTENSQQKQGDLANISCEIEEDIHDIKLSKHSEFSETPSPVLAVSNYIFPLYKQILYSIWQPPKTTIS